MKGLECGQHMGVQDMSPTCMLAKSLLLFPDGKLADKLRVEKGVRENRGYRETWSGWSLVCGVRWRTCWEASRDQGLCEPC